MQQGRQRCGKSRSKNEFTFLVKILQMAGFVNSFLQRHTSTSTEQFVVLSCAYKIN